MKTTLWATLTANGNYAQSSASNPPKPETLADFAAQATATGNFVVGRRTFEAFAAGGGPRLANVDVVVVSSQLAGVPGVKVVATPREALAHLAATGHQAAMIAGGATLHNACLADGLVDELVFNIAPVLEGKGHQLLIDQAAYRHQDIALVASRPLGGGVIQLHYRLAR